MKRILLSIVIGAGLLLAQNPSQTTTDAQKGKPEDRGNKPPVAPTVQPPASTQAPAAQAGVATAKDERPKGPEGFDIDALDRSVDPCTNFYQFACGNWRKNNPLPADKSRYGRFDELSERNLWLLRDILEEVSAKKSPSAIEKQVGDFYGACMNESLVNRKKATPLNGWFSKIDGIKSRQDMMRVVGELHRAQIPGLFRFITDEDFKDATRTMGHFYQGGLSLPDKDNYLKDDKRSTDMRQKYAEHVTRMLTLLGQPEAQASAAAQRILELETQLAKGSMDRVLLRDARNLDHKMKADQAFALAPNFEWKTYFSALGLPIQPEYNVATPDYFKQVNAYLDSVPLNDWKTYLRWHVLRANAPVLSDEFVNENFNFTGKYLRGQKELAARWKRCVRATEGAVGHALGQLFIARKFGPESKQRMDRLVDNLLAAMEVDIKGLDWMTEETKKRALIKLGTFRRRIGHPVKFRDYASVKITRDDLAGNVERARMWDEAHDLSKIGKPVDRDDWSWPPTIVNASYSPSLNHITFPAGILQPPFFDKNVDEAINYGGIGYVIGHEITHGFDDSGSTFDEKGNLNNWWTDADRKAFEERTACLVDQYSQYSPVEGVRLNGKLTLGENTADNGGLRISFMAMQKDLETKRVQPIDGFTPQQRFFLGVAQVWCENVTPQAAAVLAQTDTHSSGQFRVNGPLSNMPEFWQAYSCKPGQPMVREKACRVW